MMLTKKFPKVTLAHTPTPLEPLPNLSKALGDINIYVKRDDCTGLAMGGNKARQLEFYIGDALAKGADTLLTTGAVQSNHVRMTVAAARKLGLDVEVQLEKRVPDREAIYYESGNPLLLKLMGATIHYYPEGEDEEGADRALEERAEALRAVGKKPHVIPLSGNHTPFGALGYVDCAEELLEQFAEQNLDIAAIVVPSGSAGTHAGLLAGLKARGSKIAVHGVCVRRDQYAQAQRVYKKACVVAEMIGYPSCVLLDDARLDDRSLAPGYGQLNAVTREAIRMCAEHEGVLLDPTYTGKAMAGLIQMVRDGVFAAGDNIVFLHTGGAPALFAYPELVEKLANH